MKKVLPKFRHSKRLSTSMPDPTPDPALSVTTAQVSPHQTIAQSERSVSVQVLEDSQAKPSGSTSHLNAPLENLPPEVRRHLLSMLELDGLRALVSTSPIYYHQYLLDRRHLLCRCLEVTLRSVTVDACAVYQSSSIEFSDARTSESVSQFLKSYQDRRSGSQYSIISAKLTVDDVVRIVAFHSSIIKPLARHYTAWALDNLSKEVGDPQNHESLSITEETRLMRALYRFQLCCNLFGVGRYRSYLQPRLGFDSVDTLRIFICIFEPWEVEEIACIYSFAKEKYNQIFDDICWDINEKNPKFAAQRPPTPEGAFDLDDSWVRYSLLKGTISCGLELLHTILFKIKDHAQLVSTMQKRISWPIGNFLGDGALGETAQSQRRQEQLSNRDLRQERRDPFPFQGDEVPDANGEHPPLAWTLIWKGSYSNLYGCYVQDVIRRWGYVMWDASRLERTGAKEVLARQWRADWGDTDPRDYLL
ncbi:hypothetical protein DTO164E3_3130 [Paecilomyces variotii]|nr:hypothetical protein DTO164E3_3130 [Paecilomyces variotii]